MRIKKAEIGSYLQLLSSVVNVPNGRWAYAVSRNIKRLESVFKSVQREYQSKFEKKLNEINESLKKNKSPEIDPKAYQKAKQDLIEKYSWYEEDITVKQDGKEVVEKRKKQHLDQGSTSVYSKNQKKYEKASLLLDEEKKGEKDFFDELNKEFDVVLEQSITIDFYLVSEEGVPENISANELVQFDFMLKD